MIVGQNEKNETHSTDGLLKEETSSSSSSSSSSVGICRWNEEEQRLEISERGGNKVDGRTKEGGTSRISHDFLLSWLRVKNHRLESVGS